MTVFMFLLAAVPLSYAFSFPFKNTFSAQGVVLIFHLVIFSESNQTISFLEFHL